MSVRPGGLVGIMEVHAPDELELLRHYRRCSPESREVLLASARAAAALARKKSAS